MLSEEVGGAVIRGIGYGETKTLCMAMRSKGAPAR